MSAYRTAAPTKSLPARCAIRLDELPRASQDLLRKVSAVESASNKRERHTRLYAILATASGLFALAGVVVWSQAATSTENNRFFERSTPWDAGEITTVTGACFVVGVFLLGGIASLIRQHKAPIGTFWYAHKAYLFDCAHDRVVAYPLALLDDQEVMGETVHLSFGEIDLQIAFDTPEEAGSFLAPLQRHAKAAATCLARGARDEIDAADFIPDALLHREIPRIRWDRAWALPLVAGLSLALAGRLVLPGLHASVAEARFVEACHHSPEVCPEYQTVYPHGAHLDKMDDAFFVWTSLDKRFDQYKEGFPQGRHLPQAMIAEADTGTAALAIYRKGAVAANRQGDPRLVTAMLSTLRILNNEHTRTLPLSFGGEVDKDISRWTRAPEEPKTRAQAINDPEILGLSPGAASTAKGALSAAFLEAVGVVGAIDVREPRPGESDSEAPVRLALTYRIFKGQRIYQDQTKRKGQYLELDIDWTLTFRWPVEPRLGEVSITLHTTPSPTFNSFVGSADVVYASMLAENAKNLGPALRQALGLVPPPAEAPE